jgi:arylsulfatase A-like enzyme
VLRLEWPRPGFGLARLEAGPEGAVICRLDWQTEGGGSPRVGPVLQRPDREPRNVLLIVIDTLRADRLGIYGSGRDLTPAMDALGAQGIVFENVVAQSAWTSPATASILTGTDPTTHGVRRLGDTIDTAVPALAEVLGANGYATAAITTNINVRAELGFDRGFASYRYLPESEARKGFYAQAAEVQAEAIDWLDAQAGRPFFLYLHLSEPHAPYAPSPEAARRFVRGQPSDEIRTAPDPMEHLSESLVAGRGADLDWVRSLYDAEVATVDAMLAGLRENLKARGLCAPDLPVGWRQGAALTSLGAPDRCIADHPGSARNCGAGCGRGCFAAGGVGW